MNRIFILLLVLVAACSVNAQQSFICGTKLTPAHVQQIQNQSSAQKAASTVPYQCLKKEVSIYAYIVKDGYYIGIQRSCPNENDFSSTNQALLAIEVTL